jgi:hypothetical protein
MIAYIDYRQRIKDEMFDLGLKLLEEGGRYLTEKEMQNVGTYVIHHEVAGLERLKPVGSL